MVFSGSHSNLLTMTIHYLYCLCHYSNTLACCDIQLSFLSLSLLKHMLVKQPQQLVYSDSVQSLLQYMFIWQQQYNSLAVTLHYLYCLCHYSNTCLWGSNGTTHLQWNSIIFTVSALTRIHDCQIATVTHSLWLYLYCLNHYLNIFVR